MEIFIGVIVSIVMFAYILLVALAPMQDWLKIYWLLLKLYHLRLEMHCKSKYEV